MNLRALNSLRAEVKRWERQTFGEPPAGLPGAATAATRAPPGNWPRLALARWDEPMQVLGAVSPDCSYRLLQSALSTARTSVDVYIYNLQSDRIAALLRELPRTVKLRVMYDATDGIAARSEEKELATLKQAREEKAPSVAPRRVFTVCHQKLAVIDKTSVVLGSANWSETSIPFLPNPGTFKKGNREWLVHLKSRSVAEWFAGLFEADWNLPATRELMRAAEVALPAEVAVPARAASPPKPVDILTTRPKTRTKVTPLISPQNYFEEVQALLRGAKRSIYIQQQYILAGGPRVEGLIEAVGQQAQRLDIRIMVSPTYPENWQRSVRTLEQFGLKSKLKALNLEHYLHLHNKGLIIDGKHVVVSSTNWSENSISNAREAGVLITLPAVAAYFGKAFSSDWENGWPPDKVGARVRALFGKAPPLEPGAFARVPPGELV